MLKGLVFGFLFLFGFDSFTPAKAATVNTAGGQIVGVTGLVINSTTYNVQLFDGSCVTGFSGCDSLSDLPFTTQADALTAIDAFLDVVRPLFTSAPISNDPTAFLGCSGTIVQCLFNIPYALLPGNAVVDPSLNAAIGVATSAGFVDRFPLQPAYWVRTDDLSTSNPNVYLQFTEAAVSPVPLPAALPLLLAALGALGGIGWWRRRRVGAPAAA